MSMSREELEEIAVAARDVARTSKAQYDAYIEVGFTEAHAIRLTSEWLGIVLRGEGEGR